MALRAIDGVFGEPVEAIIDKVKVGELDPYKVFDRFEAELDRRGLSPRSINGYVNRVRQYFAYNDVVLDKSVFRVKVGLPRVIEPDDRAPTVEEVRQILAWGKLRTKALILVLASSGMRLGEAIRLRVRDVDFNSRPVRVKLSPKVASKTGEGRTAYISDEAAGYLRRYLGHRIGEGEAWVFPSEADETRHMSEDRAWRTIIQCVEKAGLGKDKETTIHGRRRIHPHSFRKLFFSRVVGVIGETAAHAMMGHGSYLKTYYKRTEEERARDYLKCVPHLTVFSESPEMSRWKEAAKIEAIKAFAKSLGISDIEVKIAKLRKETPQLDEMETIGRIIRSELGIKPLETSTKKRKEDKHNCDEPTNRSPYGAKIVTNEKELIQHLNEGWNLIKEISGGRFIIRKRNLM
jgi:integrase